ncbi:amino acid ABC transporter permease [Aquamicrobium sp. LC103]|uniref:amino acid ABC transporter permease n=1 Tax=Aquamicrobium sp. LC103 TaxID=1120658 RepID=UPI00069C34D5|nr:amino acid ABC transporter permease [Aquamicrobium sp. LC103]
MTAHIESADLSAKHQHPPSVAEAVGYWRPWRWLVSIIFTLLVAQFLVTLALNPNMQWHVVLDYMFHPVVLRGLMMTLLLTFLAMLVGFTLGTGLALFRLSPILPMQMFALGFTWLFRSIPTLVLLIFLYNLAILIPEVSLKIPFGPTLWSQDTNVLVTPFVAAIIGLGFHKAAYMSEIIRAGLLSVDDGQRQAATALGMSSGTTLRRIVLPQAMRVIIPPTGSEIISTLKLTSLVSVISMSDLLYTIETIYSRTFQTIPLLLVACIWYLVLTSILQFAQRYVERYFGRGYRAPGGKDNRAEAEG